MGIACRVLRHETGAGPYNMALDEALLDSVASDPGGDTAVVRTYAWDGPTLSLGYFQSISLLDGDDRWRGAGLLRRATGGGAILHDREVTYAAIIPRSHPLARRSTDLYHALHASLIRLLGEHGIDARRRADVESPPASPGVPRPLLCFLDRDPEDVLVGGSKVIGSAQRRRSGAVLQHGSILLGRSNLAPELPGLAELAGIDPEAADWPGLIAGAILSVLDLAPMASEATPAERAEAERLVREIYGNEAWTRRR